MDFKIHILGSTGHGLFLFVTLAPGLTDLLNEQQYK